MSDLPAEVAALAQQKCAQYAGELAALIKMHAPVKTGNLRDSYKDDKYEDGAKVESDVSYAIPVEFKKPADGGRPHVRVAIEELHHKYPETR